LCGYKLNGTSGNQAGKFILKIKDSAGTHTDFITADLTDGLTLRRRLTINTATDSVEYGIGSFNGGAIFASSLGPGTIDKVQLSLARDIAHGMTAIAATGTYFQVKSNTIDSGNYGGAIVQGLATSVEAGLGLYGYCQSTSGTATVINGSGKSGTGATSLLTAGKILSIQNNTTEKASFYGDGKLALLGNLELGNTSITGVSTVTGYSTNAITMSSNVYIGADIYTIPRTAANTPTFAYWTRNTCSIRYKTKGDEFHLVGQYVGTVGASTQSSLASTLPVNITVPSANFSVPVVIHNITDGTEEVGHADLTSTSIFFYRPTGSFLPNKQYSISVMLYMELE